jgi:hypothetical protein
VVVRLNMAVWDGNNMKPWINSSPDSQALFLSDGRIGHCISVVGSGGDWTCSVP